MTIALSEALWSAPEGQRENRPLLVLLHGHGMNEQIGFELRHRLPADLVLASLRGPMRVGGGYGWFPLDATLDLGQIDDAAHAVLAWLERQTDFSSIGILGFSQGSAIALHCLRLAPQRFAYGVVLSGFVIPGEQPGDPWLADHRPPVFDARGAADTRIPAFLVDLTDNWLATHSTATTHRYAGLGHSVSDSEIEDLATFLTAQL